MSSHIHQKQQTCVLERTTSDLSSLLQAELDQSHQAIAALQKVVEGCETARTALEAEVLAGIERLLFEQQPVRRRDIAEQLATAVLLEDVSALVELHGWQDRPQAENGWQSAGMFAPPATAPVQLGPIDDQQTQQERGADGVSRSESDDDSEAGSSVQQSAGHGSGDPAWADENNSPPVAHLHGREASHSGDATSAESQEEAAAAPHEAGASLPGSYELTFALQQQASQGSGERSASQQYMSAPEDVGGADSSPEPSCTESCEEEDRGQDVTAPASIAPLLRTRSGMALRTAATSTRAHGSRQQPSRGSQRPQRAAAAAAVAAAPAPQQDGAVVQGGLQHHVSRAEAQPGAVMQTATRSRGGKGGKPLVAKARQLKKTAGKKTGAVCQPSRSCVQFASQLHCKASTANNAFMSGRQGNIFRVADAAADNRPVWCCSMLLGAQHACASSSSECVQGAKAMYAALQEVAGTNARVRQLRSHASKRGKGGATKGAGGPANTRQTRQRAQ